MTLEKDTIINQYKIISAIGKGGMGEVFLAQDTKLDRKVALKILPPEFANDKDRMSRFVREAKSASALNHPNIITIYEISESNGTHFIATEFIDGKTLNDYIKANPPDYKSALEIAIQVAFALDEAHSAGIVHRDIKPDNVMIRSNGLAKILDFGIAKLSASSTSASDSSEDATAIKGGTSPGMIIGTANYMSPEQAKGKVVDARTDIFSFGVVLYEMIAGGLPFEGENALEMIGSILNKEPKPFDSDVPTEIQKIIGKCLRKDRDERYQTIKDVGNDLKDVRQELEFQDKLERTVSPERAEPKTQILQATTADEIHQTTTNEAIAGKPKSNRLLAVGLAVLLLSALGFFAYRYFTPTNKQIESIAVMPFVNESGNQDIEYLSDGMTETLINSLSQLPNLSVKARSSVFRYKGKDTNPNTIGKELNVQAILNGRVVQRGDQLILSLELIDAQTENVLWGNKYERKSSELITLQSEVARDVSGKLKSKLSGADAQKLSKTYTTDPEAYRLYLQGRFYWNKRAGREFNKAEGFFRQAVEKDPNFALGYVGLADIDEDRDRPKKKEYILRALALDDQLAEAHASLGYQYMLDYDWAASERELKRAMELNPNYPQAYGWNGARLMMLGRYDESLISLKRALEIDPTSAGINFYYGVLLFVSGKPDESIKQFKKLAEMEPTLPWVHSWLSQIYRMQGNYAASVEERAVSLEINDRPDDARAVRESFAKDGWNGFLREMIRQNEVKPDTSRGLSAIFFAQLGEKEKAITELIEAAKEGDFWLFRIKFDPAFDSLRGDARFQGLLKKFEPPLQ